MKPKRLVVAAIALVIEANAQICKPGVPSLTVYTYLNKTLVPNEVLGRAKYMATQVLKGAGVNLQWAKRSSSGNAARAACGETMMVSFDAKAPESFAPLAMAYATLNATSPVEIHVFYDRVSAFPDRLRMPEYLGHVLAHEITHILQGVARHSGEGVMKARWSPDDCAEMARRPLPFARVDMELIHARFRTPVASVSAVK